MELPPTTSEDPITAPIDESLLSDQPLPWRIDKWLTMGSSYSRKELAQLIEGGKVRYSYSNPATIEDNQDPNNNNSNINNNNNTNSSSSNPNIVSGVITSKEELVYPGIVHPLNSITAKWFILFHIL